MTQRIMGRHLSPIDSPNSESSGNLTQLPVRLMAELSQRHLEASRDHFLFVRGQIQLAPPSGPNPVRVAVDGEKIVNRSWTGGLERPLLVGGGCCAVQQNSFYVCCPLVEAGRCRNSFLSLTVGSQAPPTLASQTGCENEGCVCFHATTPLPVRSLAGQSGSPRAPKGRARGREGRSEGRVLQPYTHSVVPQSRAASTSCSHSHRK